jgi:hypothetical protein
MVNYTGFNGAEYRFETLDVSDGDRLPHRSAVVVFADAEGELVYVGAPPSVRSFLLTSAIWRSARSGFGAVDVKVLTYGNRDWHERVATELRQAHQPPLN